jgi:hypothetical protein
MVLVKVSEVKEKMQIGELKKRWGNWERSERKMAI